MRSPGKSSAGPSPGLVNQVTAFRDSHQPPFDISTRARSRPEMVSDISGFTTVLGRISPAVPSRLALIITPDVGPPATIAPLYFGRWIKSALSDLISAAGSVVFIAVSVSSQCHGLTG